MSKQLLAFHNDEAVKDCISHSQPFALSESCKESEGLRRCGDAGELSEADTYRDSGVYAEQDIKDAPERACPVCGSNNLVDHTSDCHKRTHNVDYENKGGGLQ